VRGGVARKSAASRCSMSPFGPAVRRASDSLFRLMALDQFPMCECTARPTTWRSAGSEIGTRRRPRPRSQHTQRYDRPKESCRTPDKSSSGTAFSRPSSLLKACTSARGHSRSRPGKRKSAHGHFEPHESSAIAILAPLPNSGRLPRNRSPRSSVLAPRPGRLNATKRVSSHSDVIRLNEGLLSQPRESRQLIVQVIRLQYPDEDRRTRDDAPALLSRSDLITNVRSRRSAQPLTSPGTVRRTPIRGSQTPD
jgi:hypothetical protein